MTTMTATAIRYCYCCGVLTQERHLCACPVCPTEPNFCCECGSNLTNPELQAEHDRSVCPMAVHKLRSSR